jgi:prevent-host-death family protein
MRTWTITEARANISNVFDEAIKDGPQRIERRDSEPVVMVAESDWKRLTAEYPTMADLILNSAVEDEDLPERQPARVITRDYF